MHKRIVFVGEIYSSYGGLISRTREYERYEEAEKRLKNLLSKHKEVSKKHQKFLVRTIEKEW